MPKTKKINTWAAVCKDAGISSKIPFDVSMLDAATQNYLIAAYQLPIIIAYKNNGWVPDYTPGNNQSKYELWLRVIADKAKPSGFGLAYGVYGRWLTGTDVGVRFVFKSRDVAIETFNDFKPIFENFILLK